MLYLKRDAILLIGGDKTGDKRFYERMIPIADRLYDLYLIEIKRGGFNMSGHQPFSNLTANFSPQRKAKIVAGTQKLKSEMALNELREAFSYSKRTSIQT